jgi:hypothetical protein
MGLFGNKDQEERRVAIEVLTFLRREIGTGGMKDAPVTLRFVKPEPHTVGYDVSAPQRLEVCFGPNPVGLFAIPGAPALRPTPEWAQMVVEAVAQDVRQGTVKVKLHGSGLGRMAYLLVASGAVAGRVWAPEGVSYASIPRVPELGDDDMMGPYRTLENGVRDLVEGQKAIQDAHPDQASPLDWDVAIELQTEQLRQLGCDMEKRIDGWYLGWKT